MDQTALALFVFDPQHDNPFDSLAEWDKAIIKVAKDINPTKILVAARCDRGGITVSERKIQQFCKKHHIADFIRTEAKFDKNCNELKILIAKHLPWDNIPYVSTPTRFKTLKDAIADIRSKSATDSDQPILIRFAELYQRLQLLLPRESFSKVDLRTVVSLLAGQYLITVLSDDFVLLQPERLNAYASAIIRAARESKDEMGSLLECDVLEARIDFKGLDRLPKADEAILLREIVQLFIDRALCLREDVSGGLLVFPSYFNRDKPDIPSHPSTFVTYSFEGPIDEIYATLVVHLHYSGTFRYTDLWKNAADFVSSSQKRVGFKLTKKPEGIAEITAYFEHGTPDDTQALFERYIADHLQKKDPNVKRDRHYTCFHSKEDISLLNHHEELVNSAAIAQAAQNLDATARCGILEALAKLIANTANQIYREYHGPDIGVDAEIEFKLTSGEFSGKGSGQRVYLQLKSGDSHLTKRKTDGQEIFYIKNPYHAHAWQSQPCDVYLVIRTSDKPIRWMNITEYLKTKTKEEGKLPVQIVFSGEPFSIAALHRLRTTVLSKTT